MKETRDSIQDIWGPRTPYFDQWSERVNERTTEEPDHWVQSACVLCSNGCGCDIGVKDGRIVGGLRELLRIFVFKSTMLKPGDAPPVPWRRQPGTGVQAIGPLPAAVRTQQLAHFPTTPAAYSGGAVKACSLPGSGCGPAKE